VGASGISARIGLIGSRKAAIIALQEPG